MYKLTLVLSLLGNIKICYKNRHTPLYEFSIYEADKEVTLTFKIDNEDTYLIYLDDYLRDTIYINQDTEIYIPEFEIEKGKK